MRGRVVAALACLLALPAAAYPIDDYPRTQIKRLEFYRLAQAGEIRGRQLPEGGKRPAHSIVLSRPLLGVDANGVIALPDADPLLSQTVASLLAPEDQPRYGIALLDYTDPALPLYAEHNGDYRSNVGSVGKILAGAAVLHQLAELYPDDIAARERILRDTTVTMDGYAVADYHKVPLFDVDARRLAFRPLQVGDRGSLWEFLDWAFSASSNAAASTVIQQATLLEQFQYDYPVDPGTAQAWLESVPWKEEGEITVRALTAPLVANGIDTDRLRQGSYFTRGGKRAAAGTTSYGTPAALVHLLALIETGAMIDEWSSLELKRLLYMTQRRIRYASHPALHDSAVYFKSGSLYSCREEPGFVCQKYKGNRKNILASVAIVESPPVPDEGLPALRYAVAVISNVLYKNSAVAHQTLALRIHRALEARHRQAPPDARRAGVAAQ